MGWQLIADSRLHDISPFVCRLDHLIPDIIDDVGIVARAAAVEIGAASTVEHVVTGQTGQEVVATKTEEPIPAGSP